MRPCSRSCGSSSRNSARLSPAGCWYGSCTRCAWPGCLGWSTWSASASSRPAEHPPYLFPLWPPDAPKEARGLAALVLMNFIFYKVVSETWCVPLRCGVCPAWWKHPVGKHPGVSPALPQSSGRTHATHTQTGLPWRVSGVRLPAVRHRGRPPPTLSAALLVKTVCVGGWGGHPKSRGSAVEDPGGWPIPLTHPPPDFRALLTDRGLPRRDQPKITPLSPRTECSTNSGKPGFSLQCVGGGESQIAGLPCPPHRPRSPNLTDPRGKGSCGGVGP